MNYKTEESKEIMKFFIVLLVVIAIILVGFWITKLANKKNSQDITYASGNIATDKVIVGTMLSRGGEYYVLCYDTSKNDANIYVTYGENYKNKKALDLYYLDLSSEFNRKYYVDEDSNKEAKKIDELKITDGTLIRIKDGKIVEYIEGIQDISTKLK
jgi:hypothetical protein